MRHQAVTPDKIGLQIMGPTGDFGQAGDAGLRLGFVKIGEAGIAVGVQREAGANMALDPLAQGFEQSSETADPARHDRTVDLNAAAGVDAGLAMQGGRLV